MPTDPRDAQLVARACEGDKEAFGDLYERYLEELYRYIYYRVAPEEEAEDLTEQVFLKAWQNLPSFRGDAPFRSWLYRIARNAIADFYRTRKPGVPLSENLTLVDGKARPEERALVQERTDRLKKAISRLSPVHQDVIILRFLIGRSTKEIADILDRSVGAVRVLQHRALKSMRTYLAAGDITNG